MKSLTEEVLLTSDDNSTTLTTQRIIYKTQTLKKEMILKEITGHEIICEKQNAFLWTAIACFVSIYLILKNAVDVNNGRQVNVSFYIFLPFLAGVIFFILYFKFKKKTIKISGLNDNIQFPITKLSKNGLDKFIKTMYSESEKRKNES